MKELDTSEPLHVDSLKLWRLMRPVFLLKPNPHRDLSITPSDRHRQWLACIEVGPAEVCLQPYIHAYSHAHIYIFVSPDGCVTIIILFPCVSLCYPTVTSWKSPLHKIWMQSNRSTRLCVSGNNFKDLWDHLILHGNWRESCNILIGSFPLP